MGDDIPAKAAAEAETVHSLESLMMWGEVLELYALDWDETFGYAPHYFTQEYWYLLVRVTFAALKGHPLTVTSATQGMKSGSNRTRENRLQKAVTDGYLLKQRSEEDMRNVCLLPTDRLVKLILGHMDRTLEMTLKRLGNITGNE